MAVVLTGLVPVVQCVYEHPDEKEGEAAIWIAGEEKNVHVPYYPKNTYGSVFGADKQATVSADSLYRRP
jgi:hypothetical protein